MQTRLLLLDIDGTLLWPSGAGRTALQAALNYIYGTAGDLENFAFGGFTDRNIIFTLLQTAGLTEVAIAEKFDQISPVMVEEMTTRIARGDHDVQPCRGAIQLLDAVSSRDDVVVGLITGNFRETAHIKLAAAGINSELFKIGAYGGESRDRADLPTLAVERAFKLTGQQFTGQQIIIIGDTPHDVTCGRGVGARSIAVLTGWSDRAEIEPHNPHYLFDDLSDTQAVLDAIFAPVG